MIVFAATDSLMTDYISNDYHQSVTNTQRTRKYFVAFRHQTVYCSYPQKYSRTTGYSEKCYMSYVCPILVRNMFEKNKVLILFGDKSALGITAAIDKHIINFQNGKLRRQRDEIIKLSLYVLPTPVVLQVPIYLLSLAQNSWL